MRRPRRPGAGVLLLLLPLACVACTDEPAPAPEPEAKDAESCRARMVEGLRARGVEDPRVLDALRAVPRHEFVPEDARAEAYEDRALPIGHGQRISRPYLVAVMAELADLQGGERVLEIGTGSGYGAAVLARLAAEVYTIEILGPLARRAEETLARLGVRNVHVRVGDGYAGWPEHAPFDAIVVTAAPPEVPEPLKEQLRVGGRLVIPVGKYAQSLRVLTRTPDGFEDLRALGVRIEPMAGEAQED